MKAAKNVSKDFIPNNSNPMVEEFKASMEDYTKKLLDGFLKDIHVKGNLNNNQFNNLKQVVTDVLFNSNPETDFSLKDMLKGVLYAAKDCVTSFFSNSTVIKSFLGDQNSIIAQIINYSAKLIVDLSDKNSNNKSMQTELGDVLAEISSLQEELAIVKEQLADLKGEQLKIEHEVEDLDDKVEDLDDKVEDINSEMLSIKDDVLSVKNDLNAFRDDIKSEKEERKFVKLELQKVEVEIKEIEEEVDEQLKELEDKQNEETAQAIRRDQELKQMIFEQNEQFNQTIREQESRFLNLINQQNYQFQQQNDQLKQMLTNQIASVANTLKTLSVVLAQVGPAEAAPTEELAPAKPILIAPAQPVAEVKPTEELAPAQVAHDASNDLVHPALIISALEAPAIEIVPIELPVYNHEVEVMANTSVV